MGRWATVSVCLFLTVAGLAAAGERLVDNGDGTFEDRETGLVWLRNADCLGSKSWAEAVAVAAALESGDCGLRDGSQAGDWRLPSANELAGLAAAAGAPEPSHEAASLPAPRGGVLAGVQRGFYWTLTSLPFSVRYACYVRLPDGTVGNGYKEYGISVWPVRR